MKPLLLTSLLALVLTTDLAQSNKGRFVRKVRIATTFYSALIPVHVEPKALLTSQHFVTFDMMLYDPEIYTTLDSLIENVHLDSASHVGKSIDARITCVVYREHGRSDTVSFGGPHMQINGRVGYVQPGALIAIGEYLPRKCRQDIYYYLDTIWLRQPAWPKYGYVPVPNSDEH